MELWVRIILPVRTGDIGDDNILRKDGMDEPRGGIPRGEFIQHQIGDIRKFH